MANIIDTVNRIGKEVSKTLESENSPLYFQETALLYSLCENLLKYIVATKKCWDKNCQLCDANDAKKENGEVVTENEYSFDGNKIREDVKKMTFNITIQEAFSLGLISEDLKSKILKFKNERNDIIHELYLFEERNNKSLMKKRLIEAETTVKELIPVLENLINNEIGVKTNDILKTL